MPRRKPRLRTAEGISCGTCGEIRPFEAFTDLGDGRYRAMCKRCRNAGLRGNRDPVETRRVLLRSKYGITPDDYDRMYQAQAGRCAICKDPYPPWSPATKIARQDILFIDHRHDDGELRGLLCHVCNAGLGSFRDDPEHLEAAISYLGRQVTRVVVIRGHKDVEQSSALREWTREADLVVVVPPSNPTVTDRFGRPHHIDYVDVAPSDCLLVECLERVKVEWEKHHPEEAHLGHAAAGMFLFYWLAPDMKTMLDLARAGHDDLLRACAADYIDSGFGQERGPTIKEPTAA